VTWVGGTNWNWEEWEIVNGELGEDAAFFTVNTNKTTYSPGETINLSGVIEFIHCANGWGMYYIQSSLEGEDSLLGLGGGVTDPRNHDGYWKQEFLEGTLTAPLQPGRYTISLDAVFSLSDDWRDAEYTHAEIEITVTRPECSDGRDNDGDDLIDMTDPGCSDGGSYDPNDDDEGSDINACENGLDDDGDGLIDMSDPGCLNPSDNNEGNTSPECFDTLDNDGDGKVDENDPDCYDSSGVYNPNDNNESSVLGACENGLDDDGDGLIDMSDPGCVNDGMYDPNDNNEGNAGEGSGGGEGNGGAGDGDGSNPDYFDFSEF
jgi:hypothetical protein